MLGVSGGGKYAAACSYAMPDRVTRVAIVSGVGPPATPLLREGLGRELEKELSEPDNAVAEDPQIREWALVTFREALRGGAAGVVQDAAIQARAWGFGPEQIQTPVQLRHGDRDEIVPLHHAS